MAGIGKPPHPSYGRDGRSVAGAGGRGPAGTFEALPDQPRADRARAAHQLTEDVITFSPRATQTWDGHDMDHYADDLGELIEALDLHDATLVGHSTGGGEVTRYIGRHGTTRVAQAVLLGAVPPLMLKTDENPEGLPIEAFDAIRAGVAADRSQFYKDLSEPFHGAHRPGATVSQGARDAFWLLGSSKVIKDVTLKVYPGAPHGLTGAYEQAFNRDLPAFLDS
jgi:non-heme chloroperoxidase